MRTGNPSVRLIGRHYHALEQKGRLSIPVSYRHQLTDGAILTRGLDGCLFLFPANNWESLALEAAALPLTKSKARDWVRLIANDAVKVNFDRQGRILIPEYLRQTASLKQSIVIVGSLNRVEIWDQSTYHTYLDKLSSQAEAIAESLPTTSGDGQ
jgi:MraZ protein